MPTELDENFPLSYREKHQETESDTNVGSEDEITLLPTFVWPSDPDEMVYVPFKTSLRRFTAMLSSIDVGGPLAYTDDGFLPYWWFIVNFSGGAMTFCEAVTNAIASCEDVQDAIHGVMQNAIGNIPSVQSAFAEWFLADEYIRGILDERYSGNQTTDPTSSNMNIFPMNECDPAKIFGQSSGLVTMLHTASIDLFQAIEEGTNIIERAELLISAFPAVGAFLPFDELAAFADDLAENGYEDYQSAYDTTEYDELRCALFCVAKENCSLSIDQAIVFYEQKLSMEIFEPSEIIRNVAQFIVTGGYPTDDIIYAMHLMVLALIKSRADVFGINFSRLGLVLATANPDPDWEIICEECAPTDLCIDPDNFSVGNVIYQDVLQYTVQSQSSSGEQRIVWRGGTGPTAFPCNLGAINFTEGAYTSYQILDENGDSIDISDLPSPVTYMLFAKPDGSPMTAIFSFTP